MATRGSAGTRTAAADSAAGTRGATTATAATADVALAATIHDPPGALVGATRRALPWLVRTYGAVAVATTGSTAPRLVRLLTDAGLHAGTLPEDGRGRLYRHAVRVACASGARHVQYLDFDRVLHWIAAAPRELAQALRAGRRAEALVLGRTPAAHRSHHLPLWATEVVANRLMADRIGLARPLDLLVPSFVLRRSLAQRLVARSRARGVAMYGEWAALVLAGSARLAYLECRGLDWETPDRHPRAVARMGLAAWRARQATPVEWAFRTTMAATIVQGFDRTRKRLGVRRPVVVRLARRARAQRGG